MNDMQKLSRQAQYYADEQASRANAPGHGIDDVRERFNGAEDVAPIDGLRADEQEDATCDSRDIPPHTPDDLPPDSQFDPEAPEIEGARFPLNDTGNGERFALYCGEDAMHVPRVGWHIWDGCRWKLDPDGIAVRRHAQSVQHRIIREIPHLTLEDWQLKAIDEEPVVRRKFDAYVIMDEDTMTVEQKVEMEDLKQQMAWIRKLKDRRSGMKADHRTFAKSAGNKGRIDALLIESTTSLSRELEDLNADPLTVNTQTGLLRFTVSGGPDQGYAKMAEYVREDHVREAAVTGRERPQYITKLMPVDYDPSAKCPGFDAFLARIQPDPEMRAFQQRWWGANMTAEAIQAFMFMYGKGANGKSVLSKLMARMFGDYSATVKIESLTGRNRRGGGDATPDLIPLVGARSAHASEPEEGERLQEGMIKEMTGGEKIMVRALHSDFIEIDPYFKLTISGNHKPDIRGTDDGIWRRVLLVPFDVQIPEAERDEKLGDRLFDQERSGILNWMIEGLLSYLEGGLQVPEAVLNATNVYREQSNPIGAYLEEACEISGSADDWMYSRDLIHGFILWQDLRGDGPWGQRAVSNKFAAEADRYKSAKTGKSFKSGKRDSSGYHGIRFTSKFRETLDLAPRNAKGLPTAGSTSSASGSHGDDYPG